MFGVEFRPLTFDDVYGLDVVKRVLRGNLKLGEFHAGYLFIGTHASGKTTIGRIFARSILCENRREDMSPCNECPSCRAFLEGRNSGYLEVDAANNGTKDKIQEIKDMLTYESISGKKIILFDEAHNITKEGKDALLLTLESGDPNVIILFCSTEADKMPNTIRSRCCDFRFSEPSESSILQKLEKICSVKKIKYDKEALHIILKAVGRHYRDAENKLQQITMIGDVTIENVQIVVSLYDNEIVSLLLALPKDLSQSIKIIDKLVNQMDVRQIYESILRLINDAIKSANGVTFESSYYASLIGTLRDNYGDVLFQLLDYILNKDKLNDLTMLQSDILILHYKFLKGGIKFRAFEAPVQANPKKKINDVAETKSVLEDKSLPPWEQDDKLREIKMGKLKTVQSEEIPETVSKHWGPETIPEQPVKKKLSKEQFNQILGESTESDKV
jgi:DNA polymerase III subunit gamma/tau